MFRTLHLLALATVCCFAASHAAADASNVVFSEITQSTGFSSVHADFNNDGREDYVVFGAPSCSGGFGLVLSNGDGTFASPVCYSTPVYGAPATAVGDFNGDGYADLAIYDGVSSVKIYDGSASGTLKQASTAVSVTNLVSLVSADLNHDGKIDLVYSDASNALIVLFGKGNNTFSIGPATSMNTAGALSVGDFDGDGKADIMSTNNSYTSTIQVFYGDGTGRFTAAAPFVDDVNYQVADVNGDGRMDLIGEPFDFSLNGSTYYKELRVMYGNANRTFTTMNIPLANCQLGSYGPAVADFNGDGTPDIAVVEGSDCSGDGPGTLNILANVGNGQYLPEQPIFSDSANELINPLTVRNNRDTLPDITAFGFSSSSEPTYLFYNQTNGAFPGCPAPNRYTGFNLCQPTGSVYPTNAVFFELSAANQTQGRKIEVWVDGKKIDEQLKDAFSYYSFLDSGQVNLSSGKHNVTLFSAGWDNLLESYSFPIYVGTNTCPVPSSPGLDVCSPLQNSYWVSSPVNAWASGAVTGTIARMEVWVDGVKKYSTYGVNTLNTNIALGSGQHTFTYYIVNTAGQKWSQTETITVQ